MSFSHTVIVAKRPREPFQPWVPNAKEAAAIADAVVVPCHSELTESRLKPVVDHIQIARTAWIIESRPDVLPQRRPPMFPAQPTSPKLLSQR